MCTLQLLRITVQWHFQVNKKGWNVYLYLSAKIKFCDPDKKIISLKVKFPHLTFRCIDCGIYVVNIKAIRSRVYISVFELHQASGKFCNVGSKDWEVEEIISGWDDLGQRSSLLIVQWQVRCRLSNGGLRSSIKIGNLSAGRHNLYLKQCYNKSMFRL